MDLRTATLCPEKELEDFLRRATAVYDAGLPLLCSDQTYNELLQILEDRFPENPWVTRGLGGDIASVAASVDAAAVAAAMVPLPYFLGSLAKVKPDGTLDKWIAKYKDHRLVTSAKLDGVSGLYHQSNWLYTRGEEGVEGLCLDAALRALQANGRVPDATKDAAVAECSVRGEIIVTRADMRAIESRYIDARHAVSSITKTKLPDKDILDRLHFVAYEVIKPEALTAKEQFEWLERHGFETVQWSHHDSRHVNNQLCGQLFVQWRGADGVYDCDGVVVSADVATDPATRGQRRTPLHAVAFKMPLPDQSAQTTVKCVHWNITKDGYIFPRIEVEPVKIAKATYTFATGKHARHIVDSVIGPGAVVILTRSNDCIPNIDCVLEPAAAGPQLPEDGTWEWVPSTAAREVPVHIRAKDLSQWDAEHKVVRLTQFMQHLHVDNVSEGSVRRLVEGGLDTVTKILAAKPADLQRLDGFEKRLSDKTVTSIHTAVRAATREDLMMASGVFGRGIGRSKIRSVLTAYPDLGVLLQSSGGPPPRGIGPGTFEEIRQSCRKYKEWLIPLQPYMAPGQGWSAATAAATTTTAAAAAAATTTATTTATTAAATTGALAGKTLVFTGFRDTALETRIRAAGGNVTGSVSKQTSMVIVPNGTVESATQSVKGQRAVALRVPIVERSAVEALL
jgi:NAD-dependent DNA ligase